MKREIRRSPDLTLSVVGRTGAGHAQSNSSEQYQNQQDDDDEPKSTATVVTGAVKRSTTDAAEAAEQRDDKNDENDRSDRHDILLRWQPAHCSALGIETTLNL